MAVWDVTAGSSGKDPSKVDRSAAYVARYAKNIAASGVAKRCEIQIAYAIDGTPASMGGYIRYRFGGDERIAKAVRRYLICARTLLFNRWSEPIYKQTATYGHFGRSDLNLPWKRPISGYSEGYAYK